MTTHTTPTHSMDHSAIDLDRLAVDLERIDFHTDPERVEELVRRAHLAGLVAPSVDVLADDHAPEVVRSRAVAHVVAHLRRIAGTGRSADHFANVA